MGSFGFAPADGLAATYDPAEQVLKLFACGEVPIFTYGFEFKRITRAGGLKFELLAWSGPDASGTRKYEYLQSFDIANLNVVDAEGSVDIVTSNNQSGQSIPVKWSGFDAEVVNINVLFKERFTIQESTPTSRSGSVQMHYSPFALTLQNASIESENIVWTFNSLETGRTQVLVNIASGFGGPPIRKICNVNVIVLDNSLIAGDTLSGTVSGPLRAILDFKGRVNIAQGIVRRTAPEAHLLTVAATLPRGVVYPVKDPLRLSQLECVFKTDSGTAIINSTGWGEYGTPVFLPHGRIGVSVIPLEEITVDIVPAVGAIRAAGIDLAFWSAELAHPVVAPGKLHDEPYYIFHMVDGSYVFVGAIDKEVIVNHAGEKVLPRPAATG